jgi:hypothetical protein
MWDEDRSAKQFLKACKIRAAINKERVKTSGHFYEPKKPGLDNPRNAVGWCVCVRDVNMTSHYIYDERRGGVRSSQSCKSISHALPVAQGFDFALSSPLPSVVRPGI